MQKSMKVLLTELQHGGVPFEDLVAERLERGMSVREIARDLGWHWTNLYEWIDRLSIELPAKRTADLSELTTSVR